MKFINANAEWGSGLMWRCVRDSNTGSGLPTRGCNRQCDQQLARHSLVSFLREGGGAARQWPFRLMPLFCLVFMFGLVLTRVVLNAVSTIARVHVGPFGLHRASILGLLGAPVDPNQYLLRCDPSFSAHRWDFGPLGLGCCLRHGLPGVCSPMAFSRDLCVPPFRTCSYARPCM